MDDFDLDLSIIEGFEWDGGNLGHIKKHAVAYDECEQVFFNTPLLLGEDETHSQIEERFNALGQTNNKRLLFIIFTLRKSMIRVISARSQNRKERKKFYRGGEQS